MQASLGIDSCDHRRLYMGDRAGCNPAKLCCKLQIASVLCRKASEAIESSFQIPHTGVVYSLLLVGKGPNNGIAQCTCRFSVLLH
jgi:hypothetical protein